MRPTATMTLDIAQQELGNLGYAVTVDPATGSIDADLTHGRHYALVTITPGHAGLLVTQWWSATGATPRKLTCQYWPDTVRQAIERATAVAAVIALAHAADVRQAQAGQVPAIIGDQLLAKYATEFADELDGVADQAPEADQPDEAEPPAEPVQGDAEPAEAVSA